MTFLIYTIGRFYVIEKSFMFLIDLNVENKLNFQFDEWLLLKSAIIIFVFFSKEKCATSSINKATGIFISNKIDACKWQFFY